MKIAFITPFIVEEFLPKQRTSGDLDEFISYVKGRTWGYRYAKEISMAGYEVSWYFLSSTYNQIISLDSNLTLYIIKENNLPFVPYFSIPLLKLLKKNLESREYDFIHIHSGTTILLTRLLHKFKIPFLIQLHDSTPRKSPINLFRFLMLRYTTKYASRVLCVNKDKLSQLVQFVGVPKEKCIYFPNAVDVELFKRRSQDEGIARFKLDNTKKYILYVGRLVKTKGVQHLIKAMSIVVKSNKRIHLLIVGFGPYETQLQRLVAQERLQNSTSFIGYVENSRLPYLYSLSDVLVLPTKYEGFGIVLIESLSCGTPVIATNRGGPVDIISNKDVGFLVKYGDYISIASKILELTENTKLRERLGINGSQLIERDYSWPKLVRELIQLYETIVSEHESV